MSNDMVIKLISNLATVLILSPFNSTNNVVTFLEIYNRFNKESYPVCPQYLSNIFASQIKEYLGFSDRG